MNHALNLWMCNRTVKYKIKIFDNSSTGSYFDTLLKKINYSIHLTCNIDTEMYIIYNTHCVLSCPVSDKRNVPDQAPIY